MGRPKAWLPFGGEPLLVRVVRRLAEVASPIVVVAAPDQALPPLPDDVKIARDAARGNGPLQGLLAGLVETGSLADAVMLLSTDAPFVCAELVRRLETLRSKPEYDAVVPVIAGRMQPLASVVATHVRGAPVPMDRSPHEASALRPLRDLVADRLARGDLRLRSLFDDLHIRSVTEEDLLACDDLRRADPALLSFRNLNTPEDYASALFDSGFGDSASPPLKE